MTKILAATIVLAAATAADAAIPQDKSTADAVAAIGGRPTVDRVALQPFPAVSVEQHGNEILVHAQSDIDVDRITIWATLSDYDHLAQFIPDISLSRIISRDGAKLLVEQSGIAAFGPIHESFNVLLSVTEDSNESITISRFQGDFRRFDARYEIIPQTRERSRVVYDATIEPSIAVPSFVAVPLIRSMIGRQFDALVQEIWRRAQRSSAVRT